ncbi:hypothetical protein MJT46_013947 [Ovis ammon polii x Ovis aries]|nr:hypothetical protein MJT46_013947 [Ovis ammon polii x Ovis aries]
MMWERNSEGHSNNHPLFGHYWTHVLFTWKSEEGLKVYVNGTLRTSDPSGKASPAYGESNDNLVLGSKQDQTKSYENRAFDEFIIWERALTPDEIAMYFTAAIGEQLSLSSTSPSFSVTPTVNTVVPTDAYHPIITNLTEERKNFRSPGIVLSYLQNMSLSLPNKSLSEETAFNLTKDSAVVPGLIDTIDTVMSHITYNLQASKPQVAIVGSSSMADFSVAKVLPKTMNSSHYRFPARGQNYIEIPHEAFHSQAWTTIVGLLYHSVHYYLSNIQPANTKIAEAANYKNCLLSATSYLISLEVSPTPKLSQNLSGSPLITVHLRHHLTQRQYIEATNESNRIFLYCAFLDFSSGEGIWSNQGCALTEGNLSYSVCRCTHLTNFAILMQVVPLELTRGHQVALSSISYIGCSLSVLCLAVTLVTFAVLSSVSTIRNQRYHIHANLSCAVLVAQVLLLISFRFEPGTAPCQVLAMLLHYFFLSAFAWMLVEGLHLYSMVIKVFGSEDSKHRYYYGIGWGFPLLICIISIVFAMDSYGTSKNCWLSLGTGAIWAFVAPALFIIVVNVGILIAVTRVISQISAENYKIHGDPSAFKLTAKAVAVLLPILGTSWVFGVLAVNNQAMVFQYMFAILNSLQVRAAFKHKTKVWSLTSSSSRQANVKPFSSDIVEKVPRLTACIHPLCCLGESTSSVTEQEAQKTMAEPTQCSDFYPPPETSEAQPSMTPLSSSFLRTMTGGGSGCLGFGVTVLWILPLTSEYCFSKLCPFTECFSNISSVSTMTGDDSNSSGIFSYLEHHPDSQVCLPNSKCMSTDLEYLPDSKHVHFDMGIHPSPASMSTVTWDISQIPKVYLLSLGGSSLFPSVLLHLKKINCLKVARLKIANGNEKHQLIQLPEGHEHLHPFCLFPLVSPKQDWGPCEHMTVCIWVGLTQSSMEILRTFSELSQADEPQIAQNQVLRAPGPGDLCHWVLHIPKAPGYASVYPCPSAQWLTRPRLLEAPKGQDLWALTGFQEVATEWMKDEHVYDPAHVGHMDPAPSGRRRNNPQVNSGSEGRAPGTDSSWRQIAEKPRSVPAQQISGKLPPRVFIMLIPLKHLNLGNKIS